MKRAGTDGERAGAGYGAMWDVMKYSSVERAVRCVRIMHLVCCVGESVCATSHLLHAVRPPKGNPNCICLPSVAKRCMEGHEKPN